MAFQLSKIIAPQFIAAGGAAALLLTVNAAGATAAVVPALTALSLWTARITNVTALPVLLTIFRGVATAPANEVVTAISIPVATTTQPYFDWSPGYQLASGESIWALAGTASALVITGDGGITT